MTRSQIKKAGKILKEKENHTKEDVESAENTLTYWRTVHGKVINEFYQIVLTEVEKINKNATVVQRLKRSPSIIAKLKRFPQMQLTTMQDIGGIRAIMNDLKEVELLRESLKKYGKEHEFINYFNYITEPKESGYRSIHLVYRYSSPNEPETDGLLVEIQIRTKLQHSWATAVETMSAFLETNLKIGEGQPKWKKYFALTSSAFSYLENTPQVPNYTNLSREDTFKQAVYEYNYNQIEPNLSAFAVAAKYINEKRSANDVYHLLKLDIEKRMVKISSYPLDGFAQANQEYTKLERENAGNKNFQVVLVSTESINELQSAFPNYFLDTEEFIKNMEIIKIENKSKN
jgi:ppGpp synthetase/RelA/SpoT-type nucleotidyltranferase